ncbi:glycosyltransferase 87 family protein [Cellulomonas sp. PhB143]|uniref:glycosyltransferase 87 family protein n=1 Tax=Cellulomonas sp. PhB143 TaxID=2485186 RepID=UPI000FACD7BA|nr:glycosyltransferase 87 family protein [Cellulomonas sp. PhB143]ROS75316.1 uncharacterized protein DUF2029 [Cellulomonas sp. PhB143]
MTDTTPRARSWRAVATGPVGVWAAFVVVHTYLLWDVTRFRAQLEGDVDLYRSWAVSGLLEGVWPVLSTDWVYPVGALLPITLPGLLSLDLEAYRVLFELLVVLLDGFAVGALLRAGRASRGGTAGAWWWLVFLAALGPISVMRLDGVAAPLTVLALVQLLPGPARPGGRVGLTAVLATVAAWVKVAPGAVLIPLALTVRRPWRRVVLPAAVVSVVVVGLALLGGAGARVLGFFGQQDSRGLQVEAGAATPFSLARLWDDSYRVVYDAPLKVLEISGPSTQWWADALNLVLLVAVAAVSFGTWRAAVRLRRAVPDGSLLPDGVARRPLDLELVLLSTLALTLCLFAFNKVGSPQYVAWFGPPVSVALSAVGLAGSRIAWRRTWDVLAVAFVVVGLLTHRLFPDHYDDFLAAQPLDTVLAALRNLLVLALAVGVGSVVAFRVRAPGARVRSGPRSG